MAIPNKPTAGTTTATVFGTATTDDYLLGTSGDDLITGGVSPIAYVDDGIDIMQGGSGDDQYVVNNGTDSIIEYANEGVDTVFASVSYTLPGEVENIVATGSTGITMTGNILANILDGSQNASVADTLRGMEGNDTYILGAGDKVIEGKAGTGTTATSVVTYSDPGGIDTITSATTVSIAALITDAGQKDTVVVGVSRTAATDTIVGQAYIENVTLTGTAIADITGNAKNNILTGNNAINTINGGAGNDILDGGINTAGADTLIGGAGNDTYIKRNAVDTFTETSATGGTDTVISGLAVDLSAVSYIENITLTGTGAVNATGNSLANVIKGNSAANTLTGGAGVDTLYGLQGNDNLNGGTGNDTMTGGRGDDTYIVDSTGDVVTELVNGGTNGTANGTADIVQSSVTFSLNTTAAKGVENLTLTGTGATNAIGNSLANALVGNAGANILNGSYGADTMEGMGGNDTYIVDNAGDIALDTGGVDTIMSTVTFNLATGGNLAGTLDTNVENITLTGSSAIDATGNSLANTMTGNAAANTMDGSTGADKLIGNAGDDTLTGGTGNDKITGGAGRDVVLTDDADSGTTPVATEQDTIIFAAGVTDTVATASSIAGVDLYSDLVLDANTNDLIDLTVIVANVGDANTATTAIDAVTGAITEATFVANMNTLLSVGSGAGFDTAGDISAAVVTATSGDLSGQSFLAVDLDKSGTFTATDFVIEITGSNFAGLTTSNFI